MMHIHTNNQKKVKYSTKSATRTFCECRANFRTGSRLPNASRFSSRTTAQLCRDVEDDYWSVHMQFAFLKHALAARKLRNTSGFSDRLGCNFRTRISGFNSRSVPDFAPSPLEAQTYIRTCRNVFHVGARPARAQKLPNAYVITVNLSVTRSPWNGPHAAISTMPAEASITRSNVSAQTRAKNQPWKKYGAYMLIRCFYL